MKVIHLNEYILLFWCVDVLVSIRTMCTWLTLHGCACIWPLTVSFIYLLLYLFHICIWNVKIKYSNSKAHTHGKVFKWKIYEELCYRYQNQIIWYGHLLSIIKNPTVNATDYILLGISLFTSTDLLKLFVFSLLSSGILLDQFLFVIVRYINDISTYAEIIVVSIACHT